MKAQFTSRDLLWLTVVIALAVGWRVDRGGFQAAIRRQHAERVKERLELQSQLRTEESTRMATTPHAGF